MLNNCYRVHVPSLELIAQAVFILECGQTDRLTETDATERPTHIGGYAGVGNYLKLMLDFTALLMTYKSTL